MKLNKKGRRWLLISGMMSTICLAFGTRGDAGLKEHQECLDECIADALDCISDWEQCIADIGDWAYCDAMYPCQSEAYACIDACSSEL